MPTIVSQERAAELEEVQKLKDKIRILSGQLANVEFTFRDPTRNFDRSTVKGVVAKLIKVKDESAMTALEVYLLFLKNYLSVCRSIYQYSFCFLWLFIYNPENLFLVQVVAGGRLYNVVVDKETTGKQLLQNGDLRRRVTIIPLNKIQSHVVPPDKQRAAANMVYS